MPSIPELLKISIATIFAIMFAMVAKSAAPPLGMVIVAQNARVDSADASAGADVYAGDNLNTGAGGTVRLRIGAGQLYIAGMSNATLAQDANRVDAQLISGTAGFSATNADPLEIETAVGTLRPADKSRAFGQATVIGVNRVLITSYEGTLLLIRNGEEHMIEAGKSYTVSVPLAPSPAAPAGQVPQPTSGGNNNGGQWVFDAVVIGGAGAAGYVLWTIFCESQSTPN
jgi:hypothetical protein